MPNVRLRKNSPKEFDPNGFLTREYTLTSTNCHWTAHLINEPRNGKGGGEMTIGNIALS